MITYKLNNGQDVILLQQTGTPLHRFTSKFVLRVGGMLSLGLTKKWIISGFHSTNFFDLVYSYF